jgi:hypothetical protein
MLEVQMPWMKYANVLIGLLACLALVLALMAEWNPQRENSLGHNLTIFSAAIFKSLVGLLLILNAQTIAGWWYPRKTPGGVGAIRFFGCWLLGGGLLGIVALLDIIVSQVVK